MYTDGGRREGTHRGSGGSGIHGYLYNELPTVRYSKVPNIITPTGYHPKPTGPELKDEKHNPTYEQWDQKISLKADDGVCRVTKEGADIAIVDAWISFPDGTSQVGELEALCQVLETDKLDVEYMLVYSDSQYLVDGIRRDLVNWKARNWCRADGTEIKNLEIWQRIDKLLEVWKDRLEVKKIKAHKGHFGNESADRNATFAVVAGINGKPTNHWIATDVHDQDYWEPEKPVPPMLHQKWCYALTSEERQQVDIDGETYHQYFLGDHSKNKDDVELLGKIIPDAGFSVVLSKERPALIDELLDYHRNNMWTTQCEMYQSALVGMVNVSSIMSPRIIWELKRAGRECLWMGNDHDDLLTIDKELVAKVQRPPRLSYRVLDEERNLRDILNAYLMTKGCIVDGDDNPSQTKIALTDLTDAFFQQEVKKNGEAGAVKLTEFYTNVDRSIEVQANLDGVSKPVKLILARGIDLPSRNMLAKLTDKNPKVYIVTWKFSRILYNYGFVLDCDDGVGIWAGVYRNKRILSTEEQAWIL
jgi:ribonuclease HI